MKRRDFIQKTILATTSAVLLPQTEGMIRKPKLDTRFIAIGETGGRTLESLYKNGLDGRYTWIKSQYFKICRLPHVERIEIQHPYSEDHFMRNRITKMPTSYEHEVPEWTGISRKGELNIILTQPTCYLGMYLPPLLTAFLNKYSFPFHTIAIQPFRFYSQREQDAAAATLQNMDVYSGKLTVVIADSIRSMGKMNLAEAFEQLYLRIFEETQCILNRINYA